MNEENEERVWFTFASLYFLAGRGSVVVVSRSVSSLGRQNKDEGLKGIEAQGNSNNKNSTIKENAFRSYGIKQRIQHATEKNKKHSCEPPLGILFPFSLFCFCPK